MRPAGAVAIAAMLLLWPALIWMPGLREAASPAGLAWLLAVLPGAVRRRRPIADFAAAVPLGLLGNALTTGALSR